MDMGEISPSALAENGNSPHSKPRFSFICQKINSFPLSILHKSPKCAEK